MGSFNKTSFRFIGYVFSFYLCFALLKRVIWFFEEYSKIYYSGDDHQKILDEVCVKSFFVNQHPNVCKDTNEKINVPPFIRALNLVIERTYLCIDVPCDLLFYEFFNSWTGILISAMIGFITISFFYSLAENKGSRNTIIYTRDAKYVPFTEIDFTDVKTNRNQID